MEDKKLGLMTCIRPITNIGDFVQSIAARQFYPQVDQYIDREKLSSYQGEKVDMIMNGWFMHEPNMWPPSKNINPLYISVHINPSAYDGMLTKEGIENFKKHEPVGCRDIATMEILRSHGIDAYFSACLTLTLGETYKRQEVSENIYIVDPLFHYWPLSDMLKSPRKLASRILKGRFGEHNLKEKVLTKYFDTEIIDSAVSLHQTMPPTSVEESFKIADEYLTKLSKAKLVITSRIHCALPCIAMGTPVIFLNGGFQGYGNRFDSRFGGLIDLFNRIDIGVDRKISNNFNFEKQITLNNIPENKKDYLEYKKKLIKTCTRFIES